MHDVNYHDILSAAPYRIKYTYYNVILITEVIINNSIISN